MDVAMALVTVLYCQTIFSNSEDFLLLSQNVLSSKYLEFNFEREYIRTVIPSCQIRTRFLLRVKSGFIFFFSRISSISTGYWTFDYGMLFHCYKYNSIGACRLHERRQRVLDLRLQHDDHVPAGGRRGQRTSVLLSAGNKADMYIKLGFFHLEEKVSEDRRILISCSQFE